MPERHPGQQWKCCQHDQPKERSGRAASFEGPRPRDLAKYGLDKPKIATLLGEGGKTLARVRIGAEKDGKRWVLADGIDKLARVEKSTVDDWPWTANDALEAPATPQAAK